MIPSAVTALRCFSSCRSSGILAQQQQAAADQDTNIEFAIDYSDENDPVYTSDEADERAVEQVMTYSTYFPVMQMHQHRHQHGKPCHHQQHHVQPLHHAVHAAVQDVTAAAAAAAAAHAADADMLMAAASYAWQKAQQVASRLAAADAAETAELVAELEATIDRLTDAEDAANDIIDHRWDRFDHGASSSLWSEVVADYINPARQYLSRLDDLIPSHSSHSGSFSGSNGEQVALEASGLEEGDPLGLLPGDLSAHQHMLAGQHEEADNFDIGLLLYPEDNTANNLALFGVRTPEEVAAAAAAAEAAGADLAGPSAWSSMLDWLSAAPYLSPFDNINPQKAAAVLLVGCTAMVFVAFLFSIVDLRAAVHAAAVGAAEGGHGSSRRARIATGTVLLRTRKAGAGFTCSAVAAAAAAAMGSACGVQGSNPGACTAEELSKPLLIDSEDDIEAAVLQAQPSAVLAPVLQKFYNPMHYQTLPDRE